MHSSNSAVAVLAASFTVSVGCQLFSGADDFEVAAATSGASGAGGGNGGSSMTTSGGDVGSGLAGPAGSGGAGGCLPSAKDCIGITPRECDGSGQWTALPSCTGSTPGCVAGACVTKASCAEGKPGAGMSCGPDALADCCDSPLIPGGTYNRSNDMLSPATVSDFRLDTYEVTIGRFRTFVEAGMGTMQNPPAAGAGALPQTPSSGWDPVWNANLAADTASLKASLICNPGLPSWTDTSGANELLPIGCVTSFEAFAFCVWDGGRLPTEAEWNYAAAGGDEQREYPWGAEIPSADKASYDCIGDGSSAGECLLVDIFPVGSKQMGNARWGSADMAGNVWEFVLDTYALYPKPCADCVNLVDTPTRVIRGGGFDLGEMYLKTSHRDGISPTARTVSTGFRCARVP